MTREEPVLLGGRYEVGELIGRGGMAEVHLGHDTRLGRPVAIKMLRSDLARDQSFIKRFRREAQSSAGLNHSSIVAVYDSGEDHTIESGGASVAVPYMVMEYVEGRTLREVLSSEGKLKTEEALRVTEGVLDALGYSHRMGIVHRDIKPANVMISDDGSVKVMDFGIARAIADTAATMTQTQAVIGTAQYLSPEQAQGQTVDARSDLYSAGCMLYELLTGRPPFIGDSPVAIAYQHVGEQPIPPSALEDSVPDELDAVVLHSLAKPREDRYQDAASFRSDLQRVRLGRPVSREATASLAALAAGAAPTLASAEPTQVYAVQTRPPEAAAAAAPPVGPVTSTFPAAVSRDERPRHRGRRAAFITVALLTAAALLAFGLMQYRAMQAEAAKVSVPPVEGKPVPTALADLRKVGLDDVVQSTARSDSVPEGSVVSQTPEPGVRVDPSETTVALVVSTGPSSVPVPQLAGMTVAEATAALAKLKLTVGKTEKVNTSEQPKDRVVGSTPKANESVEPGTVVDLSVATGLVAVPKLTTMTQDEASAALLAIGLKPRTTYRQTSQAAEGTVIAQEPDEGELIALGSEVTIRVAQKLPPPPPTPTATPTPSPTPSASATPTGTPTPSITLPGP
ncbi:serine/threonine protein kinase [Knoellia flava TL1]|uniref:non-specific serine/threonine protein kinase n=2 Tax=Knoellia flava TaxID=913969 RepID=A0A8H9KSH4_9MICO|nr:Stk1 family PASTA domain-containing Ser/Thr kinase [Knoellia flava]KGN35179.1 serine/threonine protein kinase [Knoellia flava TL1]GGB89778.1 putative serine/threonine-protein kinase [Knoellia flava]